MANENPNPEQLEVSEVLDEDELDNDPLERGMDLAEQDDYLAADRYGMTAEEQATPRSWNSRLAEEQPDKATRPSMPDEGYVSVFEPQASPSHGGEAGYDSGYSDGNTGRVVQEPDEPANDETLTTRRW